jgi:serine/threonine-protein kinase RsbW
MEIKANKQLVILNKVEELNRVVEFLGQLEENWQLPVGSFLPINLVLEEALSNVIFYAYEKGNIHEIKIDFEYSANRLDITITDTGKPFDPTKREDPDIHLSADARPIGGLGIFLIRKIMNEVSYERKGKENILRMTKVF